MKRGLLFIISLAPVILLCLTGVSAATNITGCYNITSSGSYVLNTSITDGAGVDGACINITVSDVEFDCIGWNNWIDALTNTTHGIVVRINSSAKLTNMTIKNCNITDFGEHSCGRK